jgi:hypothetical protein
MSTQHYLQLECEGPLCGEKLKIPLNPTPQGFDPMWTPKLMVEADRWLTLVRNDGSKHNFCRGTCAINGIKGLAPIERPAPPPPANAEQQQFGLGNAAEQPDQTDGAASPEQIAEAQAQESAPEEKLSIADLRRLAGVPAEGAIPIGESAEA